MSQFFSPKDVAIAIGVSESSLKRWVDKGLIRADRTAGGHRRLELDAVLQYVRSEGLGIVRPDLIGLPAGVGSGATSETDSDSEFFRAIVAGDELTARRIALDLFLSGVSLAVICDNTITPAFHRAGDLWRCGELEVYQERRACETCSRVVHELRRAVGMGPPDGPTAIGGTLDGDPYTLASGMAELVLRDVGWRASSLGNMLPFSTLNTALLQDRPQLMWLSVSSIRDIDRFCSHMNLLFDTAQACGTALVVGGQALTADVRQRVRYTTYCDNFRHLEAFARTIRPRMFVEPAGPDAGSVRSHSQTVDQPRQQP